MKRAALKDLANWLRNPYRKPLILRGARQVGKSTLVHLFSEDEELDLIEVNLEVERLSSVEKKEFRLQSLLDEIQLKKNKRITKNTLLFFDEIQESPMLLKYLRYFYEKSPELKVIAAGSLLEVALRAEDFSFPVGRVEFYHLGPMSFQEFLWATGQNFLDQKLTEWDFSDELHEAAIDALKDYYYVGGMPEAVRVFSETQSLVRMREIQSQIIQTYQADFPKYNKRINVQRISRVFNSLASSLGEKVIFSKLDSESLSRDIKRVVELLIDSRVVLSCHHSDGNSVPLEGEVDSRIFKPYFIDIGLLNAMLRLDVDSIDSEFRNNFNTKGILAEQFVAQHLNYFQGHSLNPSLFYHLKDKGTQKAEIDFLVESEQNIFPIEVKSTAKGHLKSLKSFCERKSSLIGVKVSLANFTIDDDFVKDCKLVNIPLYAIDYLKSNLGRIL